MVLLGFPWGAANRFVHGTAEVAKDPDKLDFISFLVPTVIGAALISLVVTFLIKKTFDQDKEDTEKTFLVILAGLTVLSCIGYFII